MTELLSEISNDIMTDGTLHNDTLGSALINQAVQLDTGLIKSNLAKRYSDIGSPASIPDFGTYVVNFISNTRFIITQSAITYPANGINGENVLYLSKTNFTYGTSTSFSLAAQLTKGTTLKIRITSLSNSDTSNLIKAGWNYVLGSNINWSISDVDNTAHSQTFTAIESGKSCDLKINFDKGAFLIEYFEMNSITPTRTKSITIN